MIQETNNAKAIVWQSNSEAIGEPALLIETWANDDIVSITQEGRYININYENVDELCKLLKKLKQDKKKP